MKKNENRGKLKKKKSNFERKKKKKGETWKKN
jgi:hypothetical protein